MGFPKQINKPQNNFILNLQINFVGEIFIFKIYCKTFLYTSYYSLFSNEKFIFCYNSNTTRTQIVNSIFLIETSGLTRFLKIIGLQNQSYITLNTDFILTKILRGLEILPTHTRISNLYYLTYQTRTKSVTKIVLMNE